MSEKKESSKYLYLTINEMEYLHSEAAELKMYLRGANAVLTDVVGIKKKTKKKLRSSPHRGKKIQLHLPKNESITPSLSTVPVAPAVWNAWKLIRAKAGGQNASHPLIRQAIEWLHEQQQSEGEGESRIITASRRPATR